MVKAVLDFLTVDSAEPNFALALQCLSMLLEDSISLTKIDEALFAFNEANGFPALVKLNGIEDPQIRLRLAAALSKSLRSEKNQNSAREMGFISVVVNQLSSTDPNNSAAAAVIVAALAKNGFMRIYGRFKYE
jgi:hypothetical protein